MSVLGLICARGGSKGVARKNVKDFSGKPLITWSIDVAQKCSDITDVVVSTEDQEIADVARSCGADVPFLRPLALAQDSSKQIDAIAHALRFLQDEQGKSYEAVVLLQPTCPLRTVQDVSAALQIFRDTRSDSLITVTEEDGVTLSTYYDLDDHNIVAPKFNVPKEGTNRQDYKPIYRRCGVLYIFKPDNILNHNSLYGQSISAYTVPVERSFDIDTTLDWQITEFLMEKRLHNEG